jgi:hypothetical protein
LITWVQNAPQPKQHAFIAGFTDAKAQAAFVGAVADKVAKRLGTAPRAKKAKGK